MPLFDSVSQLLARYSVSSGQAFGTLLLGLCVLCALLMKELSKGGKKSGTVTASHVQQSQPASKVEDTREQCTLVFGTQTGTAEKFAKTLKSQLESAYGTTTAFHVVDAEHYKAAELLPKEKLVIFIVATYGDGEPTDSAVDLHDYLVAEADKADIAAGSLADVTFAVFALGNRQYEHFCSMGKKVHKCMEEMGASPLLSMGVGDDDDDIDRDFDQWSSSFFDALRSSDILKAGKVTDITEDSVPAFVVHKVIDAPADKLNVMADGSGHNVHDPYLAPVMAVRELHGAESERSCVHVEVDISGCKASYEAGDHIGVYPENEIGVVRMGASLLGKPLDYCFTFGRDPKFGDDLGDLPITGPVSLEFALTHFADLLSSPSKASLKMLSAFATNKSEQDRLAMLSSLDGATEYDKYVHAPKRSLLEVMTDFPSAKPTIGAFFASIAPRLQPRYYSISSSPKLHPKSVHITCAVVREAMPTGRVHNGVASTWLATLQKGDRVPIFLRSSSFKLPKNKDTPVIMVGPGTGFAPFRGFIQERQVSKGKHGDAALYFGCRKRTHDFIYEDEMNAAVEAGALTRLKVAFSREGKQKDYVQHHILRDSQDLWSMISDKNNPGYLYICGDGKYMAKDVNRALHTIVEQEGNCSPAEAERFVHEMAENGRYHKDVW
jgi:NADPH-ferrihemoprotein reductase